MAKPFDLNKYVRRLLGESINVKCKDHVLELQHQQEKHI